MRSKFIAVYTKLIFLAYLTGNNGNPVDTHTYNVEISGGVVQGQSFGSEVKNNQYVFKHGSDNGNQAYEEDPICEGEGEKRICLCTAGYEYDLTADKCFRGDDSKQDMFCFVGSMECLFIVPEKASWDDANEICKEKKSAIADPTNPSLLREYLTTKYVNEIDERTWLTVNGTCTSLKTRKLDLQHSKDEHFGKDECYNKFHVLCERNENK